MEHPQKFLYTFDDVLIVPSKSAIEPAHASLTSTIVRGLTLPTPFLSAAMDRVTDEKMAIALGRAGGLGIIHRNCTVVEEANMVQKAKRAGVLVGASCGPFDVERAKALQKAGADVIVIDCAHGHNMNVLRSARSIKHMLKKAKIIMGNVATAEATRDIIAMKFADAIKVGVGPGSICTTRIVSGVGVPQLSAVLQVAGVAKKAGIPVIADGGMRTSGDIAKALAAGASGIMLGNLFAGAKEAPGRVVVRGGKKFKEYRGMGSRGVIESASGGSRYLTKGRKAVPEGVSALIPYGGTVEDVVAVLSSGIQVSMGYVGAKSLSEFHKKAKFIRVTLASTAESRPHSLSEILDD